VKLGLGIDTGGTYTDGVLFDFTGNAILSKAKSLTTHGNLVNGILHCIRSLPIPDSSSVKMVSLSTTLATNSVVEGKGGKVGLLLLGKPILAGLPTDVVRVIPGAHDVHGEETEPLDRDATASQVREMASVVDAFAVSGYMSVRNPSHEKEVKSIIASICPSPVVCGHELTTRLGFQERSVTACLNAALIPVLDQLIQAVEDALGQMGIRAPLMIVRGDGSLMNAATAREKPIETVLSGPAASMVGGVYLTGREDAIVVDMGGTTSDMGVVRKGKPRVNPEGAVIGGWRTRVRAADVHTIGLGGDSEVWLNRKGALEIGPRRTVPLSFMACEDPGVEDELRVIAQDTAYNPALHQPTEFLWRLADPGLPLTPEEEELLSILGEGPKSLYRLSRVFSKDAGLLPFDRLVRLGYLARGSLTPTDVLHVTQDYSPWSTEAARLGVFLQARRLGMSPEGLCEAILQEVAWKMASNLCCKLLSDELGQEASDLQACPSTALLLARALKDDGKGEIEFRITPRLPLVAIGAPVSAYFPRVAQKLHAHLDIPGDASVAGAVGAVSANVIERVQVLVQPGSWEGDFWVHGPWGRSAIQGLEEAKAYAVEQGLRYVRDMAVTAGAQEPTAEIEDEDECVFKTGTGGSVFVQYSITLTAMGRPPF